MNTQFDYRARIVSLESLHAMCARISGMSHRFTVTKVSRSRVHVEYSNPNEYGTPHPVTAIYPCFPSKFGSASDVAVALDALRYTGGTDGGYEYQAFDQLTDSPTLWRSPTKFQMNAQGAMREQAPVWESHAGINARLNAAGKPTAQSCGCTVCDVPKPEVSK